MQTKTITSTEAQNNFGQIIDAVVQGHTRYIVKRRNVSQVIIMSLLDFEQLLSDASEREKMGSVIREVSPVYNLGETVKTAND
jgi:prevent-host-death family protein